MGRVRGKGKKQTVNDAGSGEEEKIPIQRKRGRPQKPVKDEDIEENDTDKVEANGENGKDSVSSKDAKSDVTIENGRKRKRSSQVKEKVDGVKEENGAGAKPSPNDAAKSVGFRPNGNRRKNKPRRAAEVGVECK